VRREYNKGVDDEKDRAIYLNVNKNNTIKYNTIRRYKYGRFR